MLCQFTFENFKSYRDETTFDFQAVEDVTEFPETLIRTEKGTPLLPVSVVYGPNGGGKSNLLDALICAISLVEMPILNLSSDFEKDSPSRIGSKSLTPFAFDPASAEKPTSFQLYFRTGAHEFRYCLSILQETIFAESLHRKKLGGIRTSTIFERTGGKITLGTSLRKEGVSREVNPKLPYLSFLTITYHFPVIREVQGCFESCLPLYPNLFYFALDGKLLRRKKGEKIDEFNQRKKRIVSALNSMAIDIDDFRVEKDQTYTSHLTGEKRYELPLGEESDGTQKILGILPFLLTALDCGGLVIADELDAKLHPKLLRYLVSLFTNPEINRKGAQLLFTSHDLSIMKSDVFRRDEIWFSALGKNRSSEIYSLYDLRNEEDQHVSADEAFDKRYLEGRYGADPYLRQMLSWEAAP